MPVFTDSACISKNYMLVNLSKNESLLCMSLRATVVKALD